MSSVAVQPAPADTTFKDYGVNPFIDTYRDHLSTFALDVDTAGHGGIFLLFTFCWMLKLLSKASW